MSLVRASKHLLKLCSHHPRIGNQPKPYPLVEALELWWKGIDDENLCAYVIRDEPYFSDCRQRVVVIWLPLSDECEQ